MGGKTAQDRILGALQHLKFWQEGEIEKEQPLRQENKTTTMKRQVSKKSGKLRERISRQNKRFHGLIEH